MILSHNLCNLQNDSYAVYVVLLFRYARRGYVYLHGELELMAAPKGNKFWEIRSSHGRDPKFIPETLWDAACQYFTWVEDNPLKEDKGFAYQGIVTHESFDKMRAMTLEGLYLFIDISHTTWQNYREKEDFIAITTRIENVIRSQKFAGAAAELLNPNIIARDLGLSDKSETTHTGGINISERRDKPESKAD